MIATVIIVLLLIVSIVGFIAWHRSEKPIESPFVAVVPLVAALVLGGFTTLYTQGVGSAKVIIDAGGKVVGHDDTPGWSVKAPWHRVSEWDLFAQTVTYAGDKDGAPSYTGGEVNGQEVTSSVAGGAQVNFDLQVTYSLDGAVVTDLYREYRSQERFTKQVVVPSILSTVRDVPTSYKPVEFRGEKRGEATVRMTDALNEALNEYGVTVTLVTLQNIRYTDEVEASIKAVEVAQQKEAEAEANLRATEVSAQAQVIEAEAKAQARVVEAQSQAEANRILTESLTPELLQQRYLDTLVSVGEGGNLVIVPEGSTPFVQAPAAGR